MSAPEHPAPVSQPAAPRRWGLVRLVPLALIAALMVAAYATGWHRQLSLEILVSHRAAIGAFVTVHHVAAVLVFVALYAAVTASAIPGGAVLAMIGGYLFGAAVGGLGAMVGSTLGATALFLIGRGAIGEQLTRGAGPRMAAFAAGFRADAFSYILFLRLIPTPSWLTSTASGSLGVRLPIFIAATALGRVPGSVVFALFGAGLGSVIATQGAIYEACVAAGGDDCRIAVGPANVLTPTFLAALIGLALLALVPVFAKRLLMRRAPPESP
jgi:uncharacterized membrane protein YdjX (TVP38/TMEM64 family)